MLSHSDEETDSVRLLVWTCEWFCLESTSELWHWCGRTDRMRQSIPCGCSCWLERPFTDGGANCPLAVGVHHMSTGPMNMLDDLFLQAPQWTSCAKKHNNTQIHVVPQCCRCLTRQCWI